MGSFNVTCFASGQTIASRDRCYAIPIVQAKTFNPVQLKMDGEEGSLWGLTSSSVDSHGFWVPIAWPLSAVYDDYGQVNIDRNEVNYERLLNFLMDVRSNTPGIVPGKNAHHEPGFDFNAWLMVEAPELEAVLKGRFGHLDKVPVQTKALNAQMTAAWNLVFSAMQSNRLFYGCRLSELRTLSVAYLSGRAYDALVASTEALTLRWSGASMNRLALAQRAVDDSFGSADRTADEDKDDASFRRMRISDKLRSAVRIADGEGTRLRLSYRLFSKFANEHLDAGTRPTPEQFLATFWHLLQDQYMVSALNRMNIKFTPMAYSGQDYDNSIGQDYSRFVATVSAQVTADRKADA